MRHGNYSYCNAADCHDRILDQVTKHNAAHPAEYGVKHGKQREYNSIKMRHIFRRNIKRYISLHQVPWNKNFNELSKTNKSIGQKTKASDNRKAHDYSVRAFHSFPGKSKSCSEPFGP